MRVGDDNGTRNKILKAALQYVAVYGSERLSMSGVADEANLARGTVYRYFANSDQLLDGLAGYVRAGFKAQIAVAAMGGGGPRAKIERLADGRVDKETWVVVRRLREYQPTFTVEFLTSHLPDYVDSFREAFAEDFAAADYGMSLEMFADILARIMISETLLNDAPALTRKLSLSLWDAVSADVSPAPVPAASPKAPARRRSTQKA
jgi:AcrR family transcriptional regulator